MKNNSQMKQLMDLNQQDDIKLSMFLPTHKTSSEHKQDLILFKNLMNEASEKLLLKTDRQTASKFVTQLEAIASDQRLLMTSHGLMIFMTEKNYEVINVLISLKPLVVVDEAFHLSPYLNYLNQQQEVLALDLSKDRFKLFEVDKNDIKDIELEGAIYNFKDLYDDFDAQSRLSFSSSAGIHGHKDASEGIDNDTEKFFRYINQLLVKEFKHDRRELIVFATKENIGAYRIISEFEFVGVEKPMKALNANEIKAIVSTVLDDKNDQVEMGLANRLKMAYEKRMVSNDQEAILKDCMDGKIEMIIIKDELNESFSKLIKEALLTDVKIHFMKELEEKLVAIYRYR